MSLRITIYTTNLPDAVTRGRSYSLHGPVILLQWTVGIQRQPRRRLFVLKAEAATLASVCVHVNKKLEEAEGKKSALARRPAIHHFRSVSCYLGLQSR